MYSMVLDDIGSGFESRTTTRERLNEFFDVLTGDKAPPPLTPATSAVKDPSKFKSRAEFFEARDAELRPRWGHAPEQQAAWAL